MMIIDEIKVHDDEGKKVRSINFISNERVNHYNDVVDFYVNSEINRCIKELNYHPTKEEIQEYKVKLIRLMTIQRKIDLANTIKIR